MPVPETGENLVMAIERQRNEQIEVMIHEPESARHDTHNGPVLRVHLN